MGTLAAYSAAAGAYQSTITVDILNAVPAVNITTNREPVGDAKITVGG